MKELKSTTVIKILQKTVIVFFSLFGNLMLNFETKLVALLFSEIKARPQSTEEKSHKRNWVFIRLINFWAEMHKSN